MGAVENARVRLLDLWNAYEASGGKQTDFARAAGVTQGTVSTWVTKLKAGEVPKLESIEALCRGFGIPVAILFHSAPSTLLSAAQPAPSDAHAELLALALRLSEEEAAYYRDVLLAARAKEGSHTPGAHRKGR